VLRAEEEEAQMHQGPDLMEPELEFGDNTEIAATAADGPKEVRVLIA